MAQPSINKVHAQLPKQVSSFVKNILLFAHFRLSSKNKSFPFNNSLAIFEIVYYLSKSS